MNSRFTCNLAIVSAPRCWTLAACFLVLFVGQTTSVVWADEFVPTTLTSSASEICVGENVTFIADVPVEAEDNPLVNVPWQISFNGQPLGNDSLDQYVTLDPVIGSTLDAWSLEKELTFAPLRQGCFTVGVDGFIELTTINQEILPITIRVAGVPSTPLFTGFDQLLCAGGSTAGSISSFTVGEVSMDLSYTFEGPPGFDLVSESVSSLGEACDGPSANLTFFPAQLDLVGSYTLTSESSNACGTNTETLEIEVVAFPSFELTTDPICDGSDALVESDIVAADYSMSNGDNPEVVATWNNGTGTEANSTTYLAPSNGDEFIQTIDLNYSFSTFTETCSGEASVVQVVHTPEPLEILLNEEDSNPDYMCEGDNLVVSIVDEASSGQEETYSWTTTPLPNNISEDGLTYTWDAIDFDVVIEITQNSVYADVNNTNCPSEQVTFNVPVKNMPVVGWQTSDVAVCEGDVAILEAEILFTEGAVTTLAWSSDLGDNSLVGTEIGTYPLEIPVPMSNGEGSTVVTLVPTDDFGCEGESIEGLIEYYEVPVPSGTVGALCEGDDVEPTNILIGPGLDYAWDYNGATSNLSSPIFSSVTCDSELSLEMTQTYVVDGTPLSCTSQPYTIALDVTPLPSFELLLPDVACDNAEVSLAVAAVNTTEGCIASDLAYDWTIDDGSGSPFTAQGASLTVPGGDYDELNVTVVASQTSASNTCTAEVSQSIVVNANPEILFLTSDAALCPNSSALIDTEVLDDPNDTLLYEWGNAGVEIFEFLPVEESVGIILSEGSNATEGEVQLTVTNSSGCIAQANTIVDILNLPEPQNVQWSVPALCSGDEVVITMTDPLVDDAFDLSTLTYLWTASGSNGDTYAVTSDAENYSDVVSNITVNAAAWPVEQPTMVSFELILNDGTCTSTHLYENQIELYPLPNVSFELATPTYNDVCEGSDWMGNLQGASSLSYTGPLTNTFYSESIDVPGVIEWEVPWEEIDLEVDETTPFLLALTAQADYGNAVCETNWDLILEVFDAPQINLDDTDFPESICVGSVAGISSSLVPGSGNGTAQQMIYSWTNADVPEAFDIELLENGSVANVNVADMPIIPDAGNIHFNVTDTKGCSAQETFEIDIIELPVIDGLTPVTSTEACSGTAFEFEIETVSVDDGLDEADVTFAWGANVASQTAPPELNSNGSSVTVTPVIGELGLQDFVAPETLDLSLTSTIAGCSSTVNWTAVADVYPIPSIEADNTNVCIGQDWMATITGCEVLTVNGETPNPDITWTTDDPAAGMDIVLPQDYMQAPTGQTQQTFDFYAGVTYTSADLTCSNTKPFNLFRRQAPNFSVTGDDSSGPNEDLVLCEGENVTLNSLIDQVGASESFSWAQYVTDDSGNSLLEPLTTSTSTALFVDVEPLPPLNQPTITAGIAYVTYTYADVPDFECVVEEPWSFQVMPTPEVAWDVTQSHVCDGDDNSIALGLSAGSSTLNGESLTWDWDWSSSTFNNVVNTTDPSVVVSVESQYESTLDGMFEQNLMVTVTDSYGCISAPSTNSFVALERAVVELERPFVCAVDTLELLASGADVYTWDVDPMGLDGMLEDALYFPNYADTGDSLQTLTFYNPIHGDIVGVTGSLAYNITSDSIQTCSDTTDISLVVYDMPLLQMSFSSDPAPYCEGDLVVFEDTNTAGGDVVYDYWTSAGFEESQVPNNSTSFSLQSESTIFEVTKYETNANQGELTVCSVMEEVTFDVIANPVISVDGNSGICQDGMGSVICEVSNPNNAFDYTATWTSSANASAQASQPSDSIFVLSVESLNGVTINSPDPLLLSVYVEDNNGCKSDILSFNMEVLETPVLSIAQELEASQCSPSEDCMQVELLNDDLSNVDVLYYWDNEAGSPNDGICITFQNPTNCPFTDSTKVTVRYEHTLADGEILFCESSAVDSTVVNPSPQPSFSLEAPQSCLDMDALNCVPVMHDTSSYSTCADDSLSYEWFVSPLGDLIQNNLVTADLTTPFPSICVDTAGVLNLVLEITNAYGCSQTTSNASFTVRELPVPELTFEQPSICLPTTVSILNSSSGASDFSMSIPGYPTYENFLSPLELEVEFPGYYNADFVLSNNHIIGEHELTCSVEIEYVNAFEGRTPPVAEFAVLPDTLIDFVNPVVEFINLSEGQTENIWSFGNGEGSSESNPELEFETAGIYNAQLLVKNEYGCTDVYTQKIEVYTDLYIYIPTAFSPNNDGLNDAWRPSITGQDQIATYECSVFTRSGDRVFNTNDPNKAWIGGNNLSGEGTHHTSGGEVFVWRISIKKKNGQGAKTYTGQVTMIR